jgi:RecA-family ATPase
MAKLLADFVAEESPPLPMLIGRGILPCQSKMILGGAAKVGKSFLVLNVGLGLAKGTNLFNAKYPNATPVFPVYKPTKVLYIEQEVGPEGLRRRLERVLQAKPEWQFTDFYIKSKDTALRMDSTDGILALEAEIEQVQPQVLILDPLSKLHISDENSAQDMGRIMRVGDKWIEKYKLSIIYVHHTGLAAFDPQNMRRGGARLRGSSALFADVDSMVEVINKSGPSSQEPTLELGIELRQGEAIPLQYVRRLKDGTIKYLGEGSQGLAESNQHK